MNKLRTIAIAAGSLLSAAVAHAQPGNAALYKETHRPQIHFSPRAKWMNDPNGLVYANNTYHMFFQHNPDSTIWGPMHWGHATSKDLVHWEQQPIALYPDSLGTIYSGSVVIDAANTTGFGENGNPPLVAIFTYNNPVRRKEGRSDYQYQGLAYSLDNGKTWTKYARNPVLDNPGIRDFRDPKVSWHESSRTWIMTLATKDRVSFYSSPDLKAWSKESEFGAGIGAHGGVWECPDLLSFGTGNKKNWVLLVSINPGGPNGGSATQYFTGNFDGHRFVPHDTLTRWVDYGTDNYAGVTFFNTGNRHLFIGWMSNWQYANKVPTGAWRSAMTIPRELELLKNNNDYILAAKPVSELNRISAAPVTFIRKELQGGFDLDREVKTIPAQYKLQLAGAILKTFSVSFSNDAGEELLVGFDQAKNEYFIDRTRSGRVDFEKGFAKRIAAPRISSAKNGDITIVMDAASIEMFCDEGRTVMTAIFFAGKPFNRVRFLSPVPFSADSISFVPMISIWR